MVIRMRHTRAHTRNRRSHHALKEVRVSHCAKCNEMKISHKVCMNCGTYKGREIVNVVAKQEKKLAKAKKKEETS